MPYDPERHGPQRVIGPGFHARVWAMVQQVPAGRVTTYGDLAVALGLATAARQVGWALAALEGREVPWYRVVNSRGALSFAPGTESARSQRRLLRGEGVAVTAAGRVVDFATLRYEF